MKCRSFYCFLILSCVGFNQHAVLGTHEEDSWTDPDAWGREEQFQNTYDKANSLQKWKPPPDCKSSSQSGDAVALMYYKRLIAYLFKSEFFKYDKLTDEYSRVFILTALPAQLEKLMSLSDPRDLNSIVTEILTKARAPTKDDYYSFYGNDSDIGSMTILSLIWDIMKDLGQLLRASEVQFLLGAACLILLGWHCHRKYQIGIYSMIIGGVICFGYFHTYLECNRKLEAERLLEILARHEELARPEPRWYTSIFNFFTSSAQKMKQRQEYIKKSSQLDLNFCLPDQVFLMYANDLFLKQLGFLIDKCAETMEKLRDSLSFPFNYLAAFLLVFLIGYILKLTFKYILSPSAWVGVWQARGIGPNASHQHALPTSSGTEPHEDRLSGENLRMLLNAISGGASTNQITISTTAASAPSTQSPEAASGVEEILLPLENGNNADTGSESSMSEVTAKSKLNSPPKQVNSLHSNNGSKKQYDATDDCEKSKAVKLEDLWDDDA